MSETVNRERLQRFVANVSQEIKNMQAGEGTKRPGTLHFEVGKNSCPAMNRWSIFTKSPTQKNLDTFLELAAQDFGAPTGDLFKGQAQAIFTQEGAKKVPFKKAFDVEIKDAFYDMFRTARISMEPRQVERIEAIALSIAKTIEDKIATGVGFAVGNLVHAMEKQEAAEKKAAAAEKKAGDDERQDAIELAQRERQDREERLALAADEARVEALARENDVDPQ